MTGIYGGIPILEPLAWVGAALIFGLAHLMGSLFLRLIRPQPWEGLDDALLRITAGLALSALLVLAVGQFEGVLFGPGRWILGSLAIVGIAHLGSSFAGRLSRADVGFGEPTYKPDRSLAEGPAWGDGVQRLTGWICCAALLLIMLGPAFSPPINYDVLEYHVGAVKHYFDIGKIAPIPHVFYSAQPLCAEMLYTLAFLFGGASGESASGLLQWGLLVLSCLLLNRACKLWGAPALLRPWLILIFLAHPIILKLELDRLTDLMGGVFLLAGLLVLGGASKNEPDKASQAHYSLRGLFLAGFFAGAAVSSKWTNAGTTAVMLASVAFSPLLLRLFRREIGIPNAITVGAAFIVGTVLVMLPWMGWLWIRAGNPFAPFAARFFPATGWTPEQLDFLISTHGPLGIFSVEYWTNLFRRLNSFSLGPPLLALSMVLWLVMIRIRRDDAKPKATELFQCGPSCYRISSLVFGLLVASLLWGRLRHSADRFLVPVVVVSIILFGTSLAGLAAAKKPALRVAVIGCILMTLPYATMQIRLIGYMDYWKRALGAVSYDEFMLRHLGGTWDFFRQVRNLKAPLDENAPPPAPRGLALGEARGYYLDSAVALSSVFDRSPIRDAILNAASGEAVRENLKKVGFTHLIVNEHEIDRLLQFHPHPALLDDPAFRDWLSADSRIRPPGIQAFPGYAELGPGPLSETARTAYLQFLRLMRKRAIYQSAPAPVSPAFWIASL